MSDIMRLAGLNSGYDSEAMIEKMLSTYQSKIDKQNQKLTKLTWKQEAYRDVTSKLTEFKNKYFDILKKDSYLMTPSAFKKFKTTVTNKTNADKISGISVTTSSSSIEGSHSIKVSQVATATKLTGKSISTNNFELDLNKAAEFSDYTVDEDGNRNYKFALDVKVGDVSKAVEFEVSIAQDADGKIDMDAFGDAVQSVMNDKLEEAFGLTGKTSADSNVTGGLNGEGKEMFLSVVKGADGKMDFKVGGNATVTVTEKTGDFGLTRPADRVAIAAQAAVTGKNTVSVTVGDVTKNVSFEGVSDTYFNSRNESGNGAILAEYNELKLAAYKRDNNDAEPSQSELDDYTYTSTQAAKDKNSAALEKALNDAFSGEAGFVITKAGYLTSSKEFTITSVAGGTLGLTKASASNKVSTSGTLRDLGIAGADEDVKFTVNGKEISVKSTATINDLVKAVNSSGAGVTMNYSNLDGRLTVTANDMGNGGDVEIEANKFTAALGLAEDENTAMKATLGQNAIFELDGVEIYHNSNSYEFDGTKISFEDAEIGSEYTVGISKSYDDVKQTIKDFVKDYNQLIDDINKYIDTSPQRDEKNNLYEPLTDEQKEEMSDKEIEKWETAAKKGILYNDTTISGIMSKMRMALYNAVDSADGKKFGLYNMGIKTMTYKESEHGKLEIDEDEFDAAFEEHAEDIMNLFTDPDNGIMKQVNGILDDAVKTTGKVKGSLVRKAGLETGSTAKDNEIYRQMEQINKRISTLQDRYNTKEDYWWKVFTNLEKMMANMNSQTDYMTNFFGTGNYQ